MEIAYFNKPMRIERKRSRGWKMPHNTVSVCRPGKFGNPFFISTKLKPGQRIGCENFAVPTAEDAVDCYRIMCEELGAAWIEEIKRELAGKNLACFCKHGEPCHADVLLEIANAPA